MHILQLTRTRAKNGSLAFAPPNARPGISTTLFDGRETPAAVTASALSRSHAARWCLSTSSSFCLQVLVGGGITSYWSGLETRSPVCRSLGRQPDPQFGAAWGANQIPQSGEAWGANPIPSLEKPGAVTGSPFGEAWGANRIPSLGQPGVPVKDTLAAITSWPPHFSGFAHPEFVFRSVAPSRRKVGGFSSRGTQGPGCSCLWLRHPPAALCSQLAGRAEPGGAGVGGFYEQLGFHLHSVTWPHLTARDAGRGGRRKRKGGGGQPADRPRTRRPRDCLRDTVRHPPADEHANLTAAPPAPRCRELRGLRSPLLPSLSEPRLQRLRRRASRPPTPHPRGWGGGGFRVPGTNRPGKKLQNWGAVSEMHPAPPCRRESPQSRGSRPTAEEAPRERSPRSSRKICPRLRPSPLPARPASPQEPGSLRCSFRAGGLLMRVVVTSVCRRVSQASWPSGPDNSWRCACVRRGQVLPSVQ